MSLLLGGKKVEYMVANGGDSNVRAVVAQNAQGRLVEVWPVDIYKGATFYFNYEAVMGVMSLHTFHGSSEFNPGVSSGGSYYPVSNTGPTYQYSLFPRAFNSAYMSMTVYVTGGVKSRDSPSSIVIAADKDANRRVEVAYGGEGFYIQHATGGTVNTRYQYSHTIKTGDRIRVDQLLGSITVYINDVWVAQAYHASFDRHVNAKYHSGIGIYSTSAGNTSTAISRLDINGTSTGDLPVAGRMAIKRLKINLKQKTHVARLYVATGGNAKVTLDSAGWSTYTTFSTRHFNMDMNGSEIGTLTGQNGGSMNGNFYVPSDSYFDVWAWSDAGSNDRTVSSGRILVEAR